MLRHALLACALAACATPTPQTPAFSGADVRWTLTFASAGDDWINEIVRLRNGRHLAVGYLNRTDTDSDWRALAVEIEGDGRVRSRREYGEGGGVDAFWNAAETARGERIHIGFTTRIGAGGIDAYLARTDAAGALLGESTFGEADYDRVTDLAATPDDGWIMVGHSVAPGSENRRVFIVKADAGGREVWRRIYTEGESSGALSIEATPDGAYVVSGGASREDDSDMLLLKIDADGDEIWRRTVGAETSADINHGLVVRPDGRIVAVGYTASWGAEGYDLFAVTLSAHGDVLQRSLFGGAGDDRAIGARLDRDGRVWLVGYTRSAGDWDVIVAALDASGRFLPGAAILAGAADDNGACILPLPDGDLLVGGYSASLGPGGQDAFVLRMAPPDLHRAHPLFTVR
jgi:hypothetical protein